MGVFLSLCRQMSLPSIDIAHTVQLGYKQNEMKVYSTPHYDNVCAGSSKGIPVEWMDARGQEVMVWQGMMERANSWVDATLPLRANMSQSTNK